MSNTKLKFRNFLIQPEFLQKRTILGIVFGILYVCFLIAGLSFSPEAVVFMLAAIGIGIPLILFIWNRPEFGLLTIIFLATSLIRSDIVDIRLPIGGLELRDLVLIGMILLLSLKGLIQKQLVIPWWPIGVPIIIFLGLALVSTIFALFFQRVEANWVFSELRAIIFYCVFFVTVWTIKKKQTLVTIINVLFVVACLIVGVVVLQQFLGSNQIVLTAMSYSNWKVYNMVENDTGTFFGMVRIMPPGVVLIYFMTIVSFNLLVKPSRRQRSQWLLIFVFLILNIGILLTYTRALWVAYFFSLGLSLIALILSNKTRFFRNLIITIGLICLLLGVVEPFLIQTFHNYEMTNIFANRFISMLSPGETISSNSYQWRIFETVKGLQSISNNPILGTGLGNSYREITTLQGESEGWMTGGNPNIISRFTRFVHNSYLYITIKMGLPALICFLWFCCSTLIMCWILSKLLSDQYLKGVNLSILTSFSGLMMWSIFHQHFMQIESVAIIGFMAGLVVSLQHISELQLFKIEII